ncbi:MAG: glycosyltransferase [Candidatus Sumerlaeia bacterium]|nr:glycosyltransferase [Candidatus Sumerlaeia bacterium]
MQSSDSLLQKLFASHRHLAGQFCTVALRRPVTRPTGRTPLLLFSQVAWDTVWQRPQEQALYLSRHRPVVYVSPVQAHELTGRLADRWQLFRRLNGGRLLVFSPVLFSGEYRHRAVRKLNAAMMAGLLNKLMEGDKYFMLTNSPFSGALLPHLRPRRILLDLIDDFCAFKWAPPEGRSLENQLLARASHVFTGTGTLADDALGRTRAPIEYLPSGVRSKRLTKPMEEPGDISHLPHPRVLYGGTLNDRVDGDLFARTARAVPEGSVVVVGPRHDSFHAPGLPKNVHFLGLKPHEALPGYYQHCDLGIMPFADCLAARAINPIKTLEYLACGLPVLSSPIPDVVRYYRDVVETSFPAGWGDGVRRLLSEDTEELREERRHFARNRSWGSLGRAMEKRLRRLESGDDNGAF